MNRGCVADVPTEQTLASTCSGSAFMLFMGLLEVFIRSQCDLEDPCGRASTRFRSKPEKQYDFIVIGGGSAGSVVASRLSEVPHWKVLLIEAGGDEPVGTKTPSLLSNFLQSEIDWRYETEPEPMACHSSERTLIYVRGNREDYDDWAANGNPGWSYKEVLPYYKKSEDTMQLDEVGSELYGKGGLLPVSKFPYNPPISYDILKAGEELGYKVHDLNGHNATGFMIGQTTSKNGVRYSTASAFLRPACMRQNLHILLKTIVSKVLIHSVTKKVLGVEVLDQLGKKSLIYAKKEVIISGGSINSPQILLLSGVGPVEDLKKVKVRPIHDLPGVGKNLHNHVNYALFFFINETDTASLNWETAMQYLRFRNGLMSGTGLLDICAKISSSYAERPGVPDLQYNFSGYLANCAKTGQGKLLSNGARRILILPTVLHPKSRGYITLASNNPLAPPRIFANYSTVDRDITTMIEGIRFAINLTQTESLKKYNMRLDTTHVKGCDSLTFGTDTYWECAIRQSTEPKTHQTGSCKMGPSHDPMAVVDHKLRVHGIRGLRVIDNSIMPKVTSGNMNAPEIMIAEKGSHMIKEAWGVLDDS